MISENILGGIIITEFNDDFTIKYTNSGYLSMIGYTREQLENELKYKACNLVFYEDRKKALESIQHQLNTKGIAVYQHRIRRRDGNIIWVSIKEGLLLMMMVLKKVFGF